ncbi:hypothetical protein CORC01_00763 [Colletotrichum orchidophilum]|uniref:Tat pathway signal sequence n=1 Tax=Colletotrichum orchidophilum TaxID=1209926 RepID=A0A1G4BR47_9PEZI|nr:uncharacterized protein CORC01_00763 [Colletotrichum orchidophilum]OHF03901.1 hypothetical protein CORC01_00763 [Colletotrichum orchidophilum]
MSDVRDAISDIANGVDAHTSTQTSDTPDTAEPLLQPRPPRRSRAASRTSLVPHDVKDEELPLNRFHDAAFQNAFGDAKALMSQLVDVLEGSPLHISPDSTIKKLHRQAQELSRFQCPSTRIVGLVGDSGVGKSSVLNSLLDQEGLARTSNSGAACTCVVTEYHYRTGTSFLVEVELFTYEELKMQVSELLQSYRLFHLHAGEMDTHEVSDSGEQAGVARDTFRAMFRGRLDSEDFLTTEPEDLVSSTLESWLNEVIPNVGGGHTIHTLEECSSLLMRLTSEVAGVRGPAVWPFIRKIKVSLDSHILSKGLVLVDLPGLRDLNSARRRITERYLIECDEILAICNIGRATTDAGVASVFQLAEKAGLSNDIRATEAKKDWKGQHAKRIQQLSDAVTTTQIQIDEKNLQLADYEDDELTEKEKDEWIKIQHGLRKERKTLQQKRFELKQYLIETRNVAVTRQLQVEYGDKVPSGVLRVFCVSNTDYWAKRRLSRDEALPSLRLSGIITLRKHCLAIIADTQLTIATKFVVNDIPALIGDVALWIQSGAGSADAEQKRIVRETLDNVDRRLRRALLGRGSDLSRIGKMIKGEFKTRVYDEQRIGEWSEEAVAAGDDWKDWHSMSYAAFCRKYGNHCTDKIGYRDWNAEIISGMVANLTPKWDRLCSFFVNELERNVTLVDSAVDQALEYIEAEFETFPRSAVTISQALLSRKAILTSKVQALCDNFSVDLGTVRIDALTGIRTSLIGEAMERSYRSCNHEFGGGSDQRRKKIINDTIKRHDLFQTHMRDFRRRVDALADELQASIEANIQVNLIVIEASFDLIRNENIATESEGNPVLRRRLGDEIATAEEQLGRIKEAMHL